MVKLTNNSAAHSKLVADTLLEIGKKYPDITAWKNHTGQAYTPTSVIDAVNFLIKMIYSGNSHGESTIFEMAKRMLVPISFGLVGQCDISGIRKTDGKRVEIEVKTGSGRLSDKQKMFMNMIKNNNGIHIELRELKDLEILKQTNML